VDGVNRINSMTLEEPGAPATVVQPAAQPRATLSDLQRLKHLYHTEYMAPRELIYRNSVREDMLLIAKDLATELEKEQPNWETVKANNHVIQALQILLAKEPYLANQPGSFHISGSASKRHLVLDHKPLLLVQVREQDRARAGYEYAIYYAGNIGQTFEELGIKNTSNLLMSTSGRLRRVTL
jgi:hypothetical protein